MWSSCRREIRARLSTHVDDAVMTDIVVRAGTPGQRAKICSCISIDDVPRFRLRVAATSAVVDLAVLIARHVDAVIEVQVPYRLTGYEVVSHDRSISARTSMAAVCDEERVAAEVYRRTAVLTRVRRHVNRRH